MTAVNESSSDKCKTTCIFRETRKLHGFKADKSSFSFWLHLSFWKRGQPGCYLPDFLIGFRGFAERVAGAEGSGVAPDISPVCTRQKLA